MLGYPSFVFHTSMDSLQVEQPAAASGTSGVQPNCFSGLLWLRLNLLSIRPFEQYRDYPRETWQTLTCAITVVKPKKSEGYKAISLLAHFREALIVRGA
jgi:hypothetical protein